MTEPDQNQESAEAPATRSGFVAIVGKPNVGKSTLLNTMLGVKVAPITPKPQTTRRGVRGVYTQEERQLVFVDTPGFHRGSKSALDQAMHRAVRDAIEDVDAVLWVVDLRRPPNDEDKQVARLLGNLRQTPVILVGNKVDAAKYPDEALQLYKDLAPQVERTLAISALNDPEAVYALREDLMDRLQEGPFFFPADIRSDQSREEWAAELIREQLMRQLGQELPYATTVEIEQYALEGRLRRIHAAIWVEREGQKAIVIGSKGSRLRDIGTQARLAMERLFDGKVHVELWVKVRSGWSDDERALREMGIGN